MAVAAPQGPRWVYCHCGKSTGFTDLTYNRASVCSPECLAIRPPTQESTRNAYMRMLYDWNPEVWTVVRLAKLAGVKGPTLAGAIRSV